MNKKVIVEKRLCIKDSIIASLPSILSIIIWAFIFKIGFDGIANFDMLEEFKAISIVIWLMIMMSLSSKLIATPQTVWNIEEYEEE